MDEIRLEESALFRGIPEDRLEICCNMLKGRIRICRGQETVQRPGDPLQGIGLVLSGEVEAAREHLQGRRTMVAVLRPGDLFGEAVALGMLESAPVAITARTSCRIWFFSPAALFDPSREHLELRTILQRNLLTILASKTLMLGERLEILGQKTIKGKLAAYLLPRAPGQPGTWFGIPHSRTGLAELLSTDRSALSRALSELKRDGILVVDGNRFCLTDPDKLAAWLA